MCTSYAICKEIMAVGETNSIKDISPLKLIKLAYICHGYFLAIKEKPLFDDPVEAWQYGPVIRDIYFAVKHFKGSPISARIFDGVNENIPEHAKEVIATVMKLYGGMSAMQLSTITHREGTPWSDTQKKLFKNKVIPNELIMKHYKQFLKK